MAERRPLAFVLAGGYTMALIVAMSLSLSLTEAARPGSSRDLVSITLCHALAHFAVLLLALRVHHPEDSVRQVMGLRAVGAVPALGALALGAGLYPALARADALVALRFPQSAEDAEIYGALTATPTLGARVALVGALCVAMPLAEEVFFRGFVFGSLRKGRDAGLAAAATTAYFVLSRFDPRAMASLLALGVALVFTRTRAGSSLASLCAHAAFYAVPLAPVLRGGLVREDDSFNAFEVGLGLGVALAGAVVLQASSTRSARSREALSLDDA